MTETGLTPEQQRILMMPLNKARVSQRQGKFSYLEAWDVKAHLIRIFGFGGFSAEVQSAELMFQIPPGEPAAESRNWDVGYKVILRLEIPQLGCTYTEAAVGSAHLPDIGEAHDMAIKTAESDALKRCAINLGTQFGLSLYSDGSLQDVVGVAGIPQPLVGPEMAPSDSEAVKVPVSESETAMIETEVILEPDLPTLGEAIATVVETLGAGVDSDTWVASLRTYAKEPDSGKRILGVAGLKAAATPDLLRTTTTVNGTTMTLGMLADKVAAGAFLS